MGEKKVCHRCGSDKFRKGEIGESYFDPKDTKYFTMFAPVLRIQAELCLTCGALDMSLNPQDVAKVVKRIT